MNYQLQPTNLSTGDVGMGFGWQPNAYNKFIGNSQYTLAYSSDAIFNVDETGFALGTTLPSKALIRRGDTTAFKKISGRQE
jgi:hypothetical protein